MLFRLLMKALKTRPDAVYCVSKSFDLRRRPLSRYSLGNKFNSDPDMKHYTDNRKREQNDSSENV